MIATLMGAGLSAAAGLNAYIPLVLMGLVARFTDIVTLPESYRWIERPWVLGLALILLVTEIVLDKIPAVDSINDLIGTLVRPMTGGLVFSAAQAGAEVDASAWLQERPWISAIVGVGVAGAVHATKAVSRPVINVSTGGVGGPIVSTVEDASSFGLSLVALFLPLLVVVALILMAWVMWRVWRRVGRISAASTRATRDASP